MHTPLPPSPSAASSTLALYGVHVVSWFISFGIFSTFLGSWLPWIAGGLFVAPLFFPLAFSPWLLLGSWQAVYTSTVWTLTYREIKAIPNGKAEVVPAEG